MSDTIRNKVVVISGASTGVGRAAALRFAGEGAAVVLLARRKDRLEEVAEQIGPQAAAIPADVTSSRSVRAAFDQIAATFGRIDALVNSAGATVADVLQHIVTRPAELMLDVVHIRPAG
jgi:NADP-dependent 3-hydroxy acid dehydrogenase YdfG